MNKGVDWGNFFVQKPPEQKAEELKDKKENKTFKEKVRILTQNLTSQVNTSGIKNMNVGSIFRSSEKPADDLHSLRQEKRIVSEKAKEKTQSLRDIRPSNDDEVDKNNGGSTRQILKSAFLKDRPSKKSVTFEYQERMKVSQEGDKRKNFDLRIEVPKYGTALSRVSLEKKDEKKINNVMADDQEARRIKSLKQTDIEHIRRLAMRSSSNDNQSMKNTRVLDNGITLKVSGKERYTEPSYPTFHDPGAKDKVEFSTRGSNNKPRPAMSRKEKRIQGELSDLEIIVQNAMSRLHETGLIRQSHGVINSGDVINRILVERNAFNKIVSCRVQSLQQVKGVTIAKIEVQHIDSMYKKDPSLTCQTQMMAIFRHGSELTGVKKLMPDCVLNVLNPDTVVCPKSGTKYLLIKYYRIKK
jgi:hypothetical protein